MQEEAPTRIYEHALSVRLEPTKLILTGTRTTYQATGDAGSTGGGIIRGTSYKRNAHMRPYIIGTTGV